LIFAYPPPKDIDALEAIYHKEHVAMAVARLEGKTKILATKVLQSLQDTRPLISDRRSSLSFHGSLAVARRLCGSARDPANAAKISSGGRPAS
jgi:hypothetical protein